MTVQCAAIEWVRGEDIQNSRQNCDDAIQHSKIGCSKSGNECEGPHAVDHGIVSAFVIVKEGRGGEGRGRGGEGEGGERGGKERIHRKDQHSDDLEGIIDVMRVHHHATH